MSKRVVTVMHEGFGCQTGCCGHRVYVDDRDTGESSRFVFGHAGLGDDLLNYAKQLVRKKFGEEHVADLDWENSCVVTYDECSL